MAQGWAFYPLPDGKIDPLIKKDADWYIPEGTIEVEQQQEVYSGSCSLGEK